jgi:hypothetical protein
MLKFPVYPQEAESCSQAAASSNCSDAITIQSLPADIAGDVDMAQPFDGYIYGNCGLYAGERVLWYALGPFSDDTCVEVLFSSSSYSSELKFLEGSSCDDLSCRNSISGGDRVPERRVLKVPSGETILMAMTDYRSSTTGTFAIILNELECLNHDVCEQAKIITELPEIERSSTELASSALFLSNATNTSGLCDVFSYAPAEMKTVFYQVTAIQDGCMSAALFSQSTVVLAVHEGDSCDNMSCVAVVGGMEASWKTVADATYRLTVGSFGDSPFVLLLDEDDECISLQSNTECVSAELVGTERVSGSMESVSLSSTDGLGSVCDFMPFEKILWYSIDALLFSDGCVNIDVLGASGGGFAVIEGESCDGLTCLYRTYSAGQKVVLPLSLSRFYYVAVLENDGGVGGSSSDFTIEVSQVPCEELSTCASPLVVDDLPFVEIPDSDVLAIRGTAEDDLAVSFCDGIPLNSTSTYKRTWLSLTGSGECLSTFMWSKKNAYIGVYRGDSCDEMSCVARTENNYNGQFTTFFADEGESYHILVASEVGGEDGIMTLSVAEDESCQPVAANSFCGSATKVTSTFFEVSGNTSLAAEFNRYIETGSCYLNENVQAMWYIVDVDVAPVGRCMEASLESSSYNAGLVVFSGSNCNSLSCVGQQSWSPSSVNWEVMPDTAYYIAVTDFFGGDEFLLMTTVSLCFCARCFVLLRWFVLTSAPFSGGGLRGSHGSFSLS